MTYANKDGSCITVTHNSTTAMKDFILVDKVIITSLAITNDSVEHAIRVILVLQYL